MKDNKIWMLHIWSDLPHSSQFYLFKYEAKAQEKLHQIQTAA